MANHHLTVAKATFAASLLRPDVTKVDRSQVPHFHSLLETAILRCSSSNIQNCKQWLLDNILSSSQRTSSFARYLIALAKYAQNPEGQKRCSSQRQRLHILYLLNDLLHHAKFHTANDSMLHDLVKEFQSPLLGIVQQASASGKRRVCKRLETLLNLWEAEGYFEASVIARARTVMSDPSTALEPGEKEKNPAIHTKSSTREVPYLMPATHGDPSLPFYELPAGNFMLHIVPNKAISMRPQSIRPLQFTAGPADESLANAVRDFLKDVESIDHEFDRLDDPSLKAEISDMGQVLYRNETEDLVGDTYFGWSRAFCEKMTARKKAGTRGDNTRSQSRSFTGEQSPSRRKRRFSASDDDSSRSRRSDSRSRSRSRSKQQFRRQHPDEPPLRQNQPLSSTSFTPESFSMSGFHQPVGFPPPLLPSASPTTQVQQQLATAPLPHQIMGGMAFLPPRPPNWQGPWPPPPPPPPPPAPGLAGTLPPPPSSFGSHQPFNFPSAPDNRNQ